MSFLQNCDVCFNQESLPITYYNFHHKCLVRPKSKFLNWQGSQPISYMASFSQKEGMNLVNVKFNLTYQNNHGEIQVRPFLIFFPIWVFFHNHSWITGLHGKGEGISSTPHYHFHPLHRHLDISRAITAESSPPHIGRSRTGTFRPLMSLNDTHSS